MPKKNPIPSYRRQRKKDGEDRAFVLLNGERHYLGTFGTPESKDAYARIIAEWRAAGGTHRADPATLSTNELIAQFWTQRVVNYYRREDGSPTQAVTQFQVSLIPVRLLYGNTPAKGFGPKAIKACSQWFVDRGLSRKTINQRVSCIKLMIKWGVSEEMLPADAYYRVQAVAGLKRGRCNAKESPGLTPVADEVIEKTIAYLSPVVAAMVRIQRLTGLRSGELVIMRSCDLDTTGKVWIYKPSTHKTAHLGKSRNVYIGPKAVAVLKPWLRSNLTEYIFRPSEGEAYMRQRRRAERKTPEGYGNGPGDNVVRSPKRRPGDRYVPVVYGRAVSRACDVAFPPPEGTDGEAMKQWRKDHRWRPYQLRHAFGTAMRKQAGLDAVQALLGHAACDVTEVYAQVDATKAIRVIGKVG